MQAQRTNAWTLSTANFPSDGTPAAKLGFAASCAILAPSGRNTQPWRFAIKGETLELFADRSRRRWVADPDDRELEIACGAALLHVRLALRHFGYKHTVEVANGDSDLISTVRLGEAISAALSPDPLFEAIASRHTHRGEFAPRPIDAAIRNELKSAVLAEGADLTEVDEDARPEVAELVAEADRIQSSDPAFRAELSEWMRPNSGNAVDGVPGLALGLGNIVSRLAPMYFRTVDDGDARAMSDTHQVVNAPLLVVISTAGDRLERRVAAGQALARLLLRAAADHVSGSFLNQPIQIPRLNALLRGSLGIAGRPQLMLRLGHAPSDPPTPRRPLSDVLIDP